MSVRRIEFMEYAVLFGEQIRRLDYETQYAILIRRFDTSYPTGGYCVSDGSWPNTGLENREVLDVPVVVLNELDDKAVWYNKKNEGRIKVMAKLDNLSNVWAEVIYGGFGIAANIWGLLRLGLKGTYGLIDDMNIDDKTIENDQSYFNKIPLTYNFIALPTDVDPKDKGKKKIEEDEFDTESEDINESEKKFKMLAHDEEIARKMQEDWEAEEVKKLAEEEAINAALIQDFDDIKARIEADRLLALRLQEEERESSSLWKKEQKFLHDTIAAQRSKKTLCKKDVLTMVPAEPDVAKAGYKREKVKESKIVTLDGTKDSEINGDGKLSLLGKIYFTSYDLVMIAELYEACGVYILELEDGTVIHMLVERRYPLSKDLLQRMLDLDGSQGIEMLTIEDVLQKDCKKMSKLIKDHRSRCVKVFGYILQELKKINLKKHEVKQVQQSCLGEDCWELYIPDLVPLGKDMY
ncbi:hypothetical protein Tco_0340180 [Tanacetum coccineum]